MSSQLYHKGALGYAWVVPDPSSCTCAGQAEPLAVVKQYKRKKTQAKTKQNPGDFRGG